MKQTKKSAASRIAGKIDIINVWLYGWIKRSLAFLNDINDAEITASHSKEENYK